MTRGTLGSLACLLCILVLVGCGASVPAGSSLPPAQAVAQAKAALAIGYSTGDSASSVTQNVTLPATGLDGTTVTWSSDNASLLSNTGVVARPVVGNADATLTATITLGSASDTKAFSVTVKAQMTEAQAVADAKSALVISYAAGDSSSSVTQNLTLPTIGLHSTDVSWSSSDPSFITNAGAVTRPDLGDVPITITATITLGTVTDTKPFLVTVKPQFTEAQALAGAIDDLAIGYAEGDSANHLAHDVTLPARSLHGSLVTWNSSNGPVLSNAGVVHRPLTVDTNAILTATVTLGEASDTKDFPLTVVAQMTDSEAVDGAKSALAINYAPGDADTTVTQNLELPVSGANQCTVSWSSSDPSVISADGVITRPVTGDVPITLTATITSHAASDTKQFIVLVKAQMTDAQAVAAAKEALAIVLAKATLRLT